MDTVYYDYILAKEGKPSNDEYGIILTHIDEEIIDIDSDWVGGRSGVLLHV